jgi:hypothetical protein
VNDSWDSFVAALGDEAALLGRVNEAALKLTQALVESDTEKIVATERELDGARKAYVSAAGRRRGMQARGFGTLTLRQVCAYAPRPLAPTLNQRLAELATGSISLGITTNNNKALIASGMERLMKVTSVLQKAASDQPGTYKRRGYVPPPSNSVLVSSRV